MFLGDNRPSLNSTLFGPMFVVIDVNSLDECLLVLSEYVFDI